jgi:hypothetical protein
MFATTGAPQPARARSNVLEPTTAKESEMAESIRDERPTPRYSAKGMFIGAGAGAILLWLVWAYSGLDLAAGGPGMALLGGAAAGGVLGLFIGALRGSRRER